MKLTLVSLLLVCLAMSGSPALATEAVPATVPPQTFVSLPLKPQVEVVPKKIQQSETLSQWVIQTLEAEKAKVAIIAREGSPLAVLVDKTGMTHSGYVFRHPVTQQWITYSLYSDPDADYKKSRLWQQSVKSFYYGQSGSKTDSLMLIPTPDMQEKLYARLTAQPFKPLLPTDEHYSLVAPLESATSFNCTKWIILQFFAAKEKSDDTTALLQKMAQDYKAPRMRPLLLTRHVLQKKPDVNWQELTPPNTVHAVTVSSFLDSGLFDKTLYYHVRDKR